MTHAGEKGREAERGEAGGCPEPELEGRILGGFRGDLPRAAAPLHYRAGLFLVAVAVTLLPLAYVGLVGATAYGVYHHATRNAAMLRAEKVRSASRGDTKARLFGYVVPLVIGGILLVFMVKPLFAPAPKAETPRRLRREDEALLFRFVDRLCQAVGSPRPADIAVVQDVNAAASPRRGLWSLLAGDLRLTIGLPLAAGLTLRQFAGVLGHEFGHFSQKGGMRLTYVIRSVNGWFARVVYERDRWDQWLVSWSRGIDLRVGVIFYAARLMVWLVRRILWALMMAGNMVSCYMLRQMEYDADRRETLLAGSETFAETMRRIVFLSVAEGRAQNDLSSAFTEGRLADSYPHMVVVCERQMPPELREEVTRREAQGRTAFLDTHPCGRDRMAAAAALRAAGLFGPEKSPGPDGQELPASVLFRDFEGLCRSLSMDTYRRVFGEAAAGAVLCPAAEIEQRQAAEEQVFGVLNRFFQGAFSPLRPLALPHTLPPEAGQGLADELRGARQAMLDAAPAYRAAFAAYDALDTASIEIEQGQALVEADFAIKPEQFHLPSTRASDVAQARGETRRKMDEMDEKLRPFESAAARRLVCALALGAGGTCGAPDVDAALAVLDVLRRGQEGLIELRNQSMALGVLLRVAPGHEKDSDLLRAVRGVAGRVHAGIAACRQAMGQTPYPLAHGKGGTLLRDYALVREPEKEDVGALAGAAEQLVRNTLALQARLVGRLALAAEGAEDRLGLARLPEMKPVAGEVAEGGQGETA